MDADTAAEALAALSIDETLSDFERLEKYSESDIALQRLFQVRGLPECATRQPVSAFVTRAIPAIVRLSDDLEPVVRQAVAEHLPIVISILKTSDEGYNASVNSLLPILIKLISDPTNHVKTTAEKALVDLAQHITQEHLGAHVLTHILLLAHDAAKEQNRVTATQLMGSLAPALGPELCRSYVVPEIVSLSDDDIFRVRKAAASNLGCVSKVVGAEVTLNRIFPIFSRLAADDIWGVRKSCAESIVAMSESLPVDLRSKTLLPLIDAFFSDASRWVRNATFGVLGPFLATLRSEDITPELLGYFLAMADPDSVNGDAEMTYSCAFNFPAVVLTLGRDRWHELAATYSTLSQDSRWKVRRSLAMSIHEIAKLIPPASVEESLLPTYDLYLQDIDEVRFAAVQNMADLLAATSSDCRTRYLSALSGLQAETDNWRFRKALAEQLVKLAVLYPSEIVASTLLPLALQVCRDDFARVRVSACASVGPLFQSVLADLPAPRIADLAALIVSLSQDRSYSIRLGYAIACAHLAELIPADVFVNQFLHPLTTLASDQVPNVRLKVAQTLQALSQTEKFSKVQAIQATLAKLEGDTDIDVAFFAAAPGNDRPLPAYDGRKSRPQSMLPPRSKHHSSPERPRVPSIAPIHIPPLTPAPSTPGTLPGTPRTAAPPNAAATSLANVTNSLSGEHEENNVGTPRPS